MKMSPLRFASALIALLLICTSPAYAVIAGGMVANHYYYPASTVANADGLLGYNGFDASIRVTHEPGKDGNTYYASQFFWTVNVNEGGYTGIQQNSGTTKTVLFSIFGQTYDSSIDTPGSASGAVCQGFGGEGTGTQCLFTTKGTRSPAWKEGTMYTFHVTYVGTTTVPSGTADAGKNYLWQASITDTSTGTTTVIGTIHSPASNGILQGVVPQFVENFTQGSQQYSSCSQVPATTALFYAPTMYAPNNNAAQTNNASTETYGDCASIASSMMNPDNTAVVTINQSFGAPFVAENHAGHYCADALGGSDLGLNTCVGRRSSALAVANQELATDAGNRLNLVEQGLCLQADGHAAVVTTDCTTASNQEWLYMPDTKAWLNVAASQCLNASDDGALGARANVHDCDQRKNQKWTQSSPL